MAEHKLRKRKTSRYDDEVIYAAKFYIKNTRRKEIAEELGFKIALRPIYYWAENTTGAI